jgi:hypothetical protein
VIRNSILALICGAGLIAIIGFGETHRVAADAGQSNQPVYSPDGSLARPTNYREWIFLSSGLGMNYSAGAASKPAFTNVFVTPEAYRGFKATAKWPEKSMFVVEIYSAESRGSINKAGQYQSRLLGLDVEVKDSSRPSEWSYYNFDPGSSSARALGGGCNKCHSEHAAVEHTFVQFYPTLLEFAREKGVLKPGADIP